MSNKTQSLILIIPVYYGATTISETLQSLLKQTISKSITVKSITFVDDASADTSTEIIKSYVAKLNKKFACKTKLSINKSSSGLAHSYNMIKNNAGDIVITIHQDIVLTKKALQSLIIPFANSYIVATKHISYLPKKVWLTYNFWQKAFFDRFVEKKMPSHDGKFNAYRVSALKKIGYWDSKTFKTAGEDGDLLRKLEKIGQFTESSAMITHIHTRNPNFGWKDIIKKHAQYAEANGALLRRYGIELPDFFYIFFREILAVIVLLFPFSLIGVFIICTYAYLYTKNTYTYGSSNDNVKLYLLNIFLLFVSLFYALKGLITGKQT